MSEHKFWEDRYAVPNYIFGEKPSEYLVSCQSLLPKKGKALAIADGEGRNGVWIAQQGLDVLSLDFSNNAQQKAKDLASSMGVKINFEVADVHTWNYPEKMFDLVVDIFSQFSAPNDRFVKWSGMIKALKSGGLIIIQGYTPKQLIYATGGPKNEEQLYTKDILESMFSEFRNINIIEKECILNEGIAHSGMSAIICMTAFKK